MQSLMKKHIQSIIVLMWFIIKTLDTSLIDMYDEWTHLFTSFRLNMDSLDVA